MLFYWICPLVTPTPCWHWGIFWEGHHATLGCCSIAMPSSHSHSHITSAWFASSPLHRHSLTHSTPSGLAVLRSHQALEASTHYFGLVCFFPSPPAIHLLTHSTPPGLAVLRSHQALEA